jgi:hypothetical protein
MQWDKTKPLCMEAWKPGFCVTKRPKKPFATLKFGCAQGDQGGVVKLNSAFNRASDKPNLHSKDVDFAVEASKLYQFCARACFDDDECAGFNLNPNLHVTQRGCYKLKANATFAECKVPIVDTGSRTYGFAKEWKAEPGEWIQLAGAVPRGRIKDGKRWNRACVHNERSVPSTVRDRTAWCKARCVEDCIGVQVNATTCTLVSVHTTNPSANCDLVDEQEDDSVWLRASHVFPNKASVFNAKRNEVADGGAYTDPTNLVRRSEELCRRWAAHHDLAWIQANTKYGRRPAGCWVNSDAGGGDKSKVYWSDPKTGPRERDGKTIFVRKKGRYVIGVCTKCP